ARTVNHAISLCHALVFGACPAALFVGDVASGERYARLLIEQADKLGLARWRAYGHGYLGALAIKYGHVTEGLRLVRAGLAELRSYAFMRLMDFVIPEALFLAGEVAEGLSAVNRALTRSEETKERRLIAELLRIKGELLLIEGKIGVTTIENLFR